VEAVAHYRRALQLDPDLPAALVDLAWILATSEREDVRAPQEAVRLAERVAELTSQRDANVLDTLAMAYAAAGDPSRAVQTAQAALDLAMAEAWTDLAVRIRQRLELYRRMIP
jgi:tetratricopeptide (TPR) repeat protein